jgi:hypothetical protein
VVVDLWFIEKQMEKKNVRLSRAPLALQRYVLDAKGNVIPGKTKSPLAIEFQER